MAFLSPGRSLTLCLFVWVGPGRLQNTLSDSSASPESSGVCCSLRENAGKARTASCYSFLDAQSATAAGRTALLMPSKAPTDPDLSRSSPFFAPKFAYFVSPSGLFLVPSLGAHSVTGVVHPPRVVPSRCAAGPGPLDCHSWKCIFCSSLFPDSGSSFPVALPVSLLSSCAPCVMTGTSFNRSPSVLLRDEES